MYYIVGKKDGYLGVNNLFGWKLGNNFYWYQISQGFDFARKIAA